ncbi:MAG: hypothetical protein GY847_20150 [Proteobacteria bacterium]|nr:hypothetical protein [Pseudomonadota bacterium]
MKNSQSVCFKAGNDDAQLTGQPIQYGDLAGVQLSEDLSISEDEFMEAGTSQPRKEG